MEPTVGRGKWNPLWGVRSGTPCGEGEVEEDGDWEGEVEEDGDGKGKVEDGGGETEGTRTNPDLTQSHPQSAGK